MEYMPFFWIAVIVLSVFAEVNTASLVAIWFMPSALVVAILAFFKVPIYVQVLVFVVLSALFIIFSKAILKQITKTIYKKKGKNNIYNI